MVGPPHESGSTAKTHRTELIVDHFARVVSCLDMYRTKVLMYRTMVLMARLTKVRRLTCERARPPSQPSEMTGHGLFHVILLKLFLKLLLNICAQDKDHDIFKPGSRSKASLYLGVSTERKI